MSTAAPHPSLMQSQAIFFAILGVALLLWLCRSRTPITIAVRGDNTLITLDRGTAIFGAKWNTITLHEQI